MWVAVREVQCFPCLLSPPPPPPPPTSGSGLSQRGGHTNQRLLFQRLNIQHRPCPCPTVLCSNLSIGLRIFVFFFFAFLAPRVQFPILGRKLGDWYLPKPTIIVTPHPTINRPCNISISNHPQHLATNRHSFFFSFISATLKLIHILSLSSSPNVKHKGSMDHHIIFYKSQQQN